MSSWIALFVQSFLYRSLSLAAMTIRLDFPTEFLSAALLIFLFPLTSRKMTYNSATHDFFTNYWRPLIREFPKIFLVISDLLFWGLHFSHHSSLLFAFFTVHLYFVHNLFNRNNSFVPFFMKRLKFFHQGITKKCLLIFRLFSRTGVLFFFFFYSPSTPVVVRTANLLFHTLFSFFSSVGAISEVSKGVEGGYGHSPFACLA